MKQRPKMIVVGSRRFTQMNAQMRSYLSAI